MFQKIETTLQYLTYQISISSRGGHPGTQKSRALKGTRVSPCEWYQSVPLRYQSVPLRYQSVPCGTGVSPYGLEGPGTEFSKTHFSKMVLLNAFVSNV